MATIQRRGGRSQHETALFPRLWLVTALVLGKTFDAASTIIVLSLSPIFVESKWFTRTLIHELGLVTGVLVSGITAIVVITLLAETGRIVAYTLPNDIVPTWYPHAVRTGTHLFAAGWFALAGARNLTLAASHGYLLPT